MEIVAASKQDNHVKADQLHSELVAHQVALGFTPDDPPRNARAHRKRKSDEPATLSYWPSPEQVTKTFNELRRSLGCQPKMKISELADYVRDIPLRDVLERYGFEPRREGTALRAKSSLHNNVVTGGRWFDDKANIGGGGAIDLVMHLGGVDFRAACRCLVDQFRPLAAGQSDLSFPSSSRKQPALEKKPFAELMALYAARDDSNWSVAQAYLVEQRKISTDLVNKLHASVRSTPIAICPIRALYSCIVTNTATFVERLYRISVTSRPSVRALGINLALGLLSVILPRRSAW